MERPEYIKCILTGMHDSTGPVRETWCGRVPDPFEWCFVDAGHAVLSKIQNTYVLPCLECSQTVAEILLREVE